jgi:hypothetical protein
MRTGARTVRKNEAGEMIGMDETGKAADSPRFAFPRFVHFVFPRPLARQFRRPGRHSSHAPASAEGPFAAL